jgi:phosphoglycerol transferase MdoB-like AlkP superfamily enzyme
MTESKSSSASAVSGGTGLPTILLVVFIVLKLTGVISWSWWWVLSPFWIPLGIAILGFAFLLTFKYIVER